ncbi:hypothetical protein LIER_38958 [Lithospermum erythrorhizon]|uniref:DUF659 domain-containing protein n=1 Tax=Lithospermum erythrorhizon TaxID=34254 RepID=A0AAV3Q9Z2_LITER
MCSKIAHCGPDYKVPLFSTLRKKLVSGAKVDIDEYVASVKKAWVKGGCTIMSDTWSYRRQRSFINVAAYSPSGAVFLKATGFSGERHTSIKIKDIISLVIDDVGPQYVVQIVTDNATNYTAVGEMLVVSTQTRCAAQGIQLLLKDIYEQVELVHNMLESILDVENELRMLVACTEWREIAYSKSVAARNTTDIIQRQDCWEEGNNVKKVFEPLVGVLRLVDGEGSTSGYLYEAIERVCEGIKNIACENPSKYARILHLFKARREENIIHDVHEAAAFLKSAFMYNDEFNETPGIKAGITYMADFLVAEEEKLDFLREVQLLFSPTAISMLQTAHPRIWWDYCGDSLPCLERHAVRILSQPCSSSSSSVCERHWSGFEAA